MEDELKEELKHIVSEYMDSARQSGKQETSGLVATILKQMDEAIEVSVQKHVNGRITNIQKTLNEMTEKIDPMYAIFSSVNGFDRVAVWILKGLAMIGAAIVGFWTLVELIKRTIRT